MTIHKAKGLEFPIVIFPYADINIYYEKEARVWYPLNPKEFFGFEYALLNYNKDFRELNEVAGNLSTNIESERELDNINLLYVALTRAKEQLHIISCKNLNRKKGKLNFYSGLFIHFLKTQTLWRYDLDSYEFGKVETHAKRPDSYDTVEFTHFFSVPKSHHNLYIVGSSKYYWDVKRTQAIERGNLIHEIFSKIYSQLDIDSVFDEFLLEGAISLELKKILKPLFLKVVQHEALNPFYNSNLKSYNETEIISQYQDVVKPDRLVIIDNKTVVLIDYKTGTLKQEHTEQILKYGRVVKQLGYDKILKYLVYINKDVSVKSV